MAAMQFGVKASEVFTPGAPINSRDLFAGRLSQINRVIQALTQPGRHPIVFGQRGVGKTSLANILKELLPEIMSVKASCDSSDTFKSIWNRLLQKTSVSFREKAFGFSREESEQKAGLASYLGKDNGASPSDVATVLEKVHTRAVFILDEFDRVTDDAAKTKMADLIKNVSDNLPKVTLVIVGVSASVADLVGKHPSIERNLVEIEIPVMPDKEIQEIVTRGCHHLGIKFSDEIPLEVARLAGGFPHYAHLLGLSMAKACDLRETDYVVIQLFNDLVCGLAVEDAIEHYRQSFSMATKTIQQSRYPKVLCACAYARHDENGVFRATDVVEAYNGWFGEDLTLQAVVPVLAEFANAERGPVLHKVPVRSRTHYRLCDPMMRPFLRIKARSLTE